MRCEAFVKNADGRCTQGVSSGVTMLVEFVLHRTCKNHNNTWVRKGMATKTLEEQMGFFAVGTGEYLNNLDPRHPHQQQVIELPGTNISTTVHKEDTTMESNTIKVSVSWIEKVQGNRYFFSNKEARDTTGFLALKDELLAEENKPLVGWLIRKDTDFFKIASNGNFSFKPVEGALTLAKHTVEVVVAPKVEAAPIKDQYLCHACSWKTGVRVDVWHSLEEVKAHNVMTPKAKKATNKAPKVEVKEVVVTNVDEECEHFISLSEQCVLCDTGAITLD